MPGPMLDAGMAMADPNQQVLGLRLWALAGADPFQEEPLIKGADDLRSLFELLHDGTLVLLSHAESGLDLAVEIPYLAERIHPEDRMILLKLEGVRHCAFHPWLQAGQPEIDPIEDRVRLFGFDLELLSCRVEAGRLILCCNAHSQDEDFSGGDLHLDLASASLQDERGRAITLDDLREIARGYWNGFG